MPETYKVSLIRKVKLAFMPRGLTREGRGGGAGMTGNNRKCVLRGGGVWRVEWGMEVAEEEVEVVGGEMEVMGE